MIWKTFFFNLKASLLAAENKVHTIVLTYSENPKGDDTSNGRAFGTIARNMLHSQKGVEFSLLFRQGAKVEAGSDLVGKY